MRTRYGLHEKENPLFKLNIDLYKYSNTHAVMLTVQYIMYSCYHLHRSSPVEALHTVLLGCCKYMLRQYMNTKSPSEKKKIMDLFLSLVWIVVSLAAYLILSLLSGETSKHSCRWLYLYSLLMIKKKNAGIFYQRWLKHYRREGRLSILRYWNFEWVYYNFLW